MSIPSRSRPALAARLRVLALTLLVVIATTLASSVAPVAAVTTTPYGTNLVKNPSFEAGAASANGYTIVPIPSWGTVVGATVVGYGTSGFPTKKQGRHVSGGHKFYTAGPPNPLCGYAYQTIQIVGRDVAIDTGHVELVMSARVGSNVHDAFVDLKMFDTLAGVTSEVGFSKHATNRKMLLGSVSQIIPATTRSVQIHLIAPNSAGYCDAYFDKINVKLVHI